MRIALISDVHGNLLALDQVLADIREVGVDQVAFLGDAATLGPRPREVLQRLKDLACPCILGNHDEFLLEPSLVDSYTRVPVIVEAIDWCRSRLSQDELEFVATFQRQREVELGAGRTLLLFHGSPLSHTTDLLATTPADLLESQLGARRGEVMAGGHTHIQMLRQHRGAWIVNPGSVGMPFREYVCGARPDIQPYAEYALVNASKNSVGVELRRVELDKRALREAVADWPCPPELLRDDMLLQYA